MAVRVEFWFRANALARLHGAHLPGAIECEKAAPRNRGADRAPRYRWGTALIAPRPARRRRPPELRAESGRVVAAGRLVVEALGDGLGLPSVHGQRPPRISEGRSLPVKTLSGHSCQP
jgi:hypothetical protein